MIPPLTSRDLHLALYRSEAQAEVVLSLEVNYTLEIFRRALHVKHSLPFVDSNILKLLIGWRLVPRINGDGARLDTSRLPHSSACSYRASDDLRTAIMPSLSDLDHYKIETRILEDGNEVVSYEYVTNVGLGLRNAKFAQRWYRRANLGQGSSSDVWLEIQRGNPESKRAVKAISKRRLVEINVDYTRELKALTEFSKPKYRQKGVFVDFLGWWDNRDSVFLAMEYFPLGNLEDNILSGPPNVPATNDILVQLLEGLDIMHAEGFAHRDLKPANIFVVQKEPKWWVKIGDFGISKRIQNQDTSLRTFTGTHDYMAPEFFGYGDDVDEERSDYTHAVDLWALGCVVYRLYTGKVPFPSYPNLRPLQRYCTGQTSFPARALLSTEGPGIVVCLIMNLLSPGPSQRPSAKAALEVLKLLRIFSKETPRRHKENVLEAREPLSAASSLGLMATNLTNLEKDLGNAASEAHFAVRAIERSFITGVNGFQSHEPSKGPRKCRGREAIHASEAQFAVRPAGWIT